MKTTDSKSAPKKPRIVQTQLIPVYKEGEIIYYIDHETGNKVSPTSVGGLYIPNDKPVRNEK